MKVADVDIIIGVVWIVFWLYWIVSSFGAKPGRTRWGRFAAVRLVIIAIVVIFLHGREFKWREHGVTHNWWLVSVGLALFLLGLGLAVWARLYLGRNWGMPMSTKDDPELVTTGPYHWVRNPIYSGLILATIGTAVAVSVYWLIATALLGGYFVYSGIKEGSYLAEQFPDTYPAYKKSTKMLIPFIF